MMKTISSSRQKARRTRSGGRNTSLGTSAPTSTSAESDSGFTTMVIQKKMSTQPLECKYCGMEFDSLKQVEQHYLVHVTSDRPYKCQHCHMSFALMSSLKMHQLKHSFSNNTFMCQVCNRNFSTKGNLKAHVMRKHSETEKHLCDVCHESFSKASLLQTHKTLYRHDPESKQRLQTEDKMDLMCKDCGKTFSTLRTLEKHMLVHRSNRPYVCSICHSSYSVITSLKTHYRTKHSEENDPQVCFQQKAILSEVKIETDIAEDHMWSSNSGPVGENRRAAGNQYVLKVVDNSECIAENVGQSSEDSGYAASTQDRASTEFSYKTIDGISENCETHHLQKTKVKKERLPEGDSENEMQAETIEEMKSGYAVQHSAPAEGVQYFKIETAPDVTIKIECEDGVSPTVSDKKTTFTKGTITLPTTQTHSTPPILVFPVSQHDLFPVNQRDDHITEWNEEGVTGSKELWRTSQRMNRAVDHFPMVADTPDWPCVVCLERLKRKHEREGTVRDIKTSLKKISTSFQCSGCKALLCIKKITLADGTVQQSDCWLRYHNFIDFWNPLP